MPPSLPAVDSPGSRSAWQKVGLVVGLLGLLVLVVVPVFPAFAEQAAVRTGLPADHPEARAVAAGMQATLAVLWIMVVWWVTEAAPIPITALLPGFLLPLLHVTGWQDGRPAPFDARAALSSFANPVIYLFLAGFLLAGALRKCGLDRRLTLLLLSRRRLMRGPGTILLVVMLLTAALSMWMSNTAITAMMLPIATTILLQLRQEPGRSPFGAALLLGVAWAASIGGLATIIGTPPNGIVVGILRQQGLATFDFVGWMKIGGPLAAVLLAAAWAVLMLRHRPRLGDTSAGLAAVRAERGRLGRMTVDEAATLAACGLVVGLWVTQPFWKHLLPAEVCRRLERFDVEVIGLLGAVLLFIVPLERRTWRTVLTWQDARYVEWGTLILFGGGLALSDAMFRTGLTDAIAQAFVTWIGRPGPWVSLTLIVLLVDFLTEVTSNTAVASMMTPVLIGLAPELGLPPVTLVVAAGLASSLAFMLPVATPPNALVYGSGYVTIGQMARAGFLMNLLGCAVVALGLYYVSGRLLGAVPW